MTHFFEKRDSWGHGPALWILAAMGFLVPLCWWSLKQVHLENDVENWLPSGDPHAKAFHWYESHFPVEDRVLVSWQGSWLGDPRETRFVEALRGTLAADGVRRDGVKYVAEVIGPGELIERMTRRGIERSAARERLQGVLIGRGMLKVRLSEAGTRQKDLTVELIAREARAKLGLEVEVSPAFAALDEGIENFSDEALPAGATLPMPAHDFQVAWRGMHVRPESVRKVQVLLLDLSADGVPLVAESFFAPGAPIALSVTLSEAGAAEKADALAALRKAAESAGIPESDLKMGGGAVAGAELNQEVKNAAWNPAYPLYQIHKRSPLLLSAALCVVLAFAMLRSARLAILVLFSAFYTTIVSMAIVPPAGGSMNMVLVVMPTLLMVLTVSGAIHLANYWAHAARRNPRTAIVQAVRMAAWPCFLASATTAIGLASLATSPLVPVRDFGIYSAIGCLISLAIILYGLPSMLQFWPGTPPAQSRTDESRWHALAGWLTRHSKSVSFACLVLFVGTTWGLVWFRTETKVIRYFPDDAPIVRDYHFLEESLAGIVPVETIVRFDAGAQRDLNFLERMELVRRVQERIQSHPEISGTLSLADFQPVRNRPADSASFIEKARYHKTANEMERRIKEDPESDARSFVAFADKPADLYAPGDQKLNRAGDELWRITAQVAVMSDMDYGTFTADLDRLVTSAVSERAGVEHVITGLVPLFLRTQQAVLESLIVSFVLAFALIALIMMVLLRHPISGLLSMLPNILPVGVVFGAISWAGITVDIGTMITASVALGIAVDGTLHLLTWFRDAVVEGRPRREAIARAMAHCGPAMWQTSAAIGLGLLMLAPAELLLISRFGWLMAALIAAALFGDLILLPALLAGSLGTLIERTAKPRKSEEVLLGHSPCPKPHLEMATFAAGKRAKVAD
jgi:predicted RND superfamily exporter protein